MIKRITKPGLAGGCVLSSLFFVYIFGESKTQDVLKSASPPRDATAEYRDLQGLGDWVGN